MRLIGVDDVRLPRVPGGAEAGLGMHAHVGRQLLIVLIMFLPSSPPKRSRPYIIQGTNR